MTSTFAYEDLEVLRNRAFGEIVVGDRASIRRTLTAADIQLFAAMSGEAAADPRNRPAAQQVLARIAEGGYHGRTLTEQKLPFTQPLT